MKTTNRLLLVALVVALVPAATMAAIADTIIVERTFWLGYWDSSVDGSIGIPVSMARQIWLPSTVLWVAAPILESS